MTPPICSAVGCRNLSTLTCSKCESFGVPSQLTFLCGPTCLKSSDHQAIHDAYAKPTFKKRVPATGSEIRTDIIASGASAAMDVVVYKGDVNTENQPHGKGIIIIPDSSCYHGRWLNGERNGICIFYRDCIGNTIESGVFERDVPVKGTCKFKLSGNVYTGPLNSKGQMHGDKGHLKRATSASPTVQDEKIISIYEGRFENGLEDGDGCLTYADQNGRITLMSKGAVFKGSFSKGIPIEGSCTYPNGDKFKGHVDDVCEPHGSGVLKKSDGSVAEGNFKHGRLHGKGKETFSDGSTFEGYYENGYMSGYGTYIYAGSGDSYSGAFHKDLKHGQGIYRWKNGDCFSGEFVEGLICGKGVMTYTNGLVEEGEWKEEIDSKGRRKLIAYYVRSSTGSVQDQGWFSSWTKNVETQKDKARKKMLKEEEERRRKEEEDCKRDDDEMSQLTMGTVDASFFTGTEVPFNPWNDAKARWMRRFGFKVWR